jgi:hypothetical protein
LPCLWLEEKSVRGLLTCAHFHPSHKINKVSDRKNDFENGNRVEYELVIGIPPHRAPGVLRRSALIREGQNYMNVDKYTLETG